MILFCIFYLSQSKLYFVLTYVLVENFQTTSSLTFKKRGNHKTFKLQKEQCASPAARAVFFLRDKSGFENRSYPSNSLCQNLTSNLFLNANYHPK
ncbi:MAG: hypothetical protein ACI9XO_004199 [Paraglaciecola sp.]|jgi:hypothetical protein